MLAFGEWIHTTADLTDNAEYLVFEYLNKSHRLAKWGRACEYQRP